MVYVLVMVTSNSEVFYLSYFSIFHEILKLACFNSPCYGAPFRNVVAIEKYSDFSGIYFKQSSVKHLTTFLRPTYGHYVYRSDRL